MPVLGTTVNNLVDRVSRDAYLSSRGPVYTLDGLHGSTTSTTVVVNESPSHIGGSGAGTIIAVDYELMYVTDVQPGTKTLTVIRGYMGSTAAVHLDNALVEIDPRMPKAMLADFAQQEIHAWEKELWRVASHDVSTTTTQRAFDLGGGYTSTDTIYFLLDVRSKPVGSDADWYDFSWTGNAWPHVDARLVRGMSTSEFASGYAIQLKHPARAAGTLRVTLAIPFDIEPFDGSLDLVNTVGIKPQWLEIVELGIRYRAYDTLVMGRTNWRTGSVVRDAEEVSTFDVMRAGDQARARRDMRFTKAAVDLRADFPYRDVS